MTTPIRVTVWNEYRHERSTTHPASTIYPQGIHHAIADHLRTHPDLETRTATLDEPDHGLTDTILAHTDVMLWWGHLAHNEVRDEIVAKIHTRILEGMGLIVLHSAHFSKIFKRLMGTTCDLKWRESNDHERIWIIEPAHPIAAGLDECIELGPEEMYGERFDIPAPETLIFVSWFSGGETFRSGCCYTRGRGKIFYFRPGHESFPTYYHPDIRRVLVNAIRWAAPTDGPTPQFGNTAPRERP